MSDKETFEKWIDMQSPRYDTLKLHDGSYRNPVTALLWRTWEQSRLELFKEGLNPTLSHSKPS